MHKIDATGLACPLPVLRLQKKLRAMPPGGRLELLATDPMTAIDVPHFCTAQGHKLTAHTKRAGVGPDGADVLVFEIEKARIEKT